MAKEDGLPILIEATAALAAARQAGDRLGLDAEAAAIPILLNALGMAVAEAAGPKADRGRAAQVTNLATRELSDLVGLHWRLLYGKGGEGRDE